MKSQHGGKREGAGRPAKAPTKPLTIRCEQEILDALEAHKEGDESPHQTAKRLLKTLLNLS